MVVLLTWQYFFAPQKPAEDPNKVDPAAVASPTPTATGEAPAGTTTSGQTAAPTAPDETPNRVIKIRSPLYEVTLDSKGAVATGWVLLRNRSPKNDRELFANGSTETDQRPLQLISEKATEMREFPFRLTTPDQNVTALLNDRNYQVAGEETEITVGAGEERQIVFSLVADNGIEVKKSFVFRGDSYMADLAVDAKQNGQPLPNTRLAIGASIGDHAINHHTFYQIESESVARLNGDIYRHQGYYSFTYDSNENARLTDKGTVDWAGVADAYFAMAAIPAAPGQDVDYFAHRYVVDTEPFFEGIFSWIIRSQTTTEKRHLVTAYLPINPDGSINKVFTGPKDYFLLQPLDAQLSDAAGRELDFVNLINFSNYRIVRWFVKPLSIPILYALNYFNGITLNYGWAIVIFTFLFYSLLFPLRWKQSKSFKKAGANAPKMKEMQEKLKALQKKGVPNDDPRMRALQMEQLKLTKDALPIGGCLPMLLQFPLLISFYTAITISLDARQASFLWLPDLSAADPWHILLFAFAVSMVLAMKFTPQPTAAAMTDEQRMQQKMQQRMMTYFMPLMMLWVMWSAPSGLLLYWFFGNIVSFGQQIVINKMTKPPETAEVVVSVPANAKKVKSK